MKTIFAIIAMAGLCSCSSLDGFKLFAGVETPYGDFSYVPPSVKPEK